MSFRTKLLSLAAIGLCMNAGVALADTASAKIALSNNYAGNSWRQAMLKSWEKVTGQAVKDGVVLDLRYEARDIDQRITSQERIDQWFEAKTRGLTPLAKAQLKAR